MKARQIFILIAACLMATTTLAQRKTKFTEEDAKQFYRTIQGEYKAQINDSVRATLHFAPIWQNDGRFHWLYMEAFYDKSRQIIEQKVIEIVPVTQLTYKIIVHDLKDPAIFAGKWGNRNFFDGYTTDILKGKSRFKFIKTKDFEYQTTSFYSRKSLQCFSKGDRVHFKFVQGDERLYIKILRSRSSKIDGVLFIKTPTDIG